MPTSSCKYSNDYWRRLLIGKIELKQGIIISINSIYYSISSVLRLKPLR